MNPAQVICLFQRFDGMDVLLYTIYVQEYGDNPNCGSPNKKWVYLSYLDSVQYLRPKVPAANYGGLTLRTMVYHELLIGYLDYIKAHGFTSMFIWACPPTAVRPICPAIPTNTPSLIQAGVATAFQSLI